jgi:hypothetical protein
MENKTSVFWTRSHHYDDQQVIVGVKDWIDKPDIIESNVIAIAENRKETKLLPLAYKVAVYLMGADYDTKKIILN